jgi:hypothetical protein
MTGLRDLQQRFVRALAGDPDEPLENLVVRRGIAPAERVSVYRANVQSSFRGAMELGFPAIARLVGTQYFRQMVGEYQGRHPSRSGSLQQVGAEFSGYVATVFRGSPYAYLGEVAEIEWAYQEILIAAEHGPLDIARLAALAPDEYSGLRLTLHPAVRTLESRYPLVRIWRANRRETLDSTPIDLNSGGERILLQRRGLDVLIHRLQAADFAFLESVARGAPLSDALEAAARAEPDIDTAAMVTHYVRSEVVVDFRARASRTRAVTSRDNDFCYEGEN